MVNRTLSIQSQAESFYYDTYRSFGGSYLFQANFIYAESYDGPVITVMPDEHTMFQLMCKPDWPMFKCSAPVRHDGWLYSYEVEMAVDEYN